MKLRAWIEATRLRTLPVSIAGVITAIGFNILNGTLKPVPATLCLLFAILCQIASNYANEYFDYTAGRDRQGRQGPRRGVTEGDITPRAMKTAILCTIALAGCVGLPLIYWGGWWLTAIGGIIVLALLAYSTGPFPLSTNGLGEVAVIIFFGVIPVSFTYYVQAHEWAWDVVVAGISIGLLGANVLIINNYRDIDDDMAVNKRTLAVRLGRTAMVGLYAANALVAMGLMIRTWVVIGIAWCIVPLLVLTASGFIAVKMYHLRGSSLTKLLGLTSMVMFVYSILLFIACSVS